MARDTKSTKGAKKDRFQTAKQVIQVYQFASKDRKDLPVWLVLSVLLPVLLMIAFNIATHSGWIWWVFSMVLALTLGVMIATIVLTRIADSVGYARMEGQSGASSAVLRSINKSGYNFDEAPVWFDRKTKDGVWQGTGRSGVFLIGEGNKQRLTREMNRLEAAIHRVTPGSQIPVYRIFVGNGEGQTPLRKLRSTVIKKKIVMSKTELDQLNGRITSLQTQQQQMPRSVDPKRLKISRRMMR